MGRLIVTNAMTVNGAFETPAPDNWLVLDDDGSNASLEQFLLADAMVLGRKTYEGHVGPVRLRLTASTAYPSGVLWLRYRPAADPQDTSSAA